MSRRIKIPIAVPIPDPQPPPPPPPGPSISGICGDGICDPTETCETCPEDCGPCTETNANPAVSNETIVYDTVDDNFTRIPDSKIRRMGHFAGALDTGTSDAIFVLGGYAGFGNVNEPLTRSSESLNVTTLEWSDTADIPTPRAFGMSARHGNKIYCIGGIELDPILNRFTVSRKIESLDMINEVWNPSLTPMPEDSGIAYGVAEVQGDFIYVMCGVTTMQNRSDPGEINTKLLRYDINTDEWLEFTPSSLLDYQRISPFSLYRSLTVVESKGIQTGEDDASVLTSTALWTNSGAAITTLITRDGYLRFPINVPIGSIFQSAEITMNFVGFVGGPLTLTLLNEEPEAFPNTTASIPYTDSDTSITVIFADLTLPLGEETFDISSLVSEFINRTTYTPGDYIGFSLRPTTGSVTIASFEHTTRNAASLSISYNPNEIYVYGGSLIKSQEDIDAELSEKQQTHLREFRAFLAGSEFARTLNILDKEDFIIQEEDKILNNTSVAAYIYPKTGFRFRPGTEVVGTTNTINISDVVDDDWPILPSARDEGQSIYVGTQDTAYFIGGSNQTASTTLNKIESIELSDGDYATKTALERGRTKHAAVLLGTDIYILGGMTSGHQSNYVQIQIRQVPGFIQSTGRQSNGFLVTLTNDAGELVSQDVRVIVRGEVRIKEVDNVLVRFFAQRGSERVRQSLPQISQEAIAALSEAELSSLISQAQNRLTNPNSDEFQMNSAKKLDEEVRLFPILYNTTDFIVENGIGGCILEPRSEDPLHDFNKLSEFIQKILDETLPGEEERFLGNLTREELASLGDVLQAIDLPPTIVNSGEQRNLYEIETSVTVIDDFLFGQTVSDFDETIQDRVQRQIKDDLLDLAGQVAENLDRPSAPRFFNNEDLFGHRQEDGQSTSAKSKVPLFTAFKNQLPTLRTLYYNNIDWIPQIKQYLVDGDTTPDEAITFIDIIDKETPFGGSQLYSAMFEAARISAGNAFDDLKKSIYILSDNSQNLSLISRDDAIEEVNSIDGDGKTPVIYTVFSTSFPATVAAQLERTDRTDIEQITISTNGQASTLVSSLFLDQVLNLTLGSAAGGLGYGIYRNKVDLGELSAITGMITDFNLPVNTVGTMRFRYSQDGFNFTDFSEKFDGSQTLDLIDFFAKIIEFEIVLATGFTVDIEEEYDAIATGIPKFRSLTVNTSAEKEDFLFINKEDVLTNVQQLAVGVDATVPENALIEVGAATSNSHQWNDFQSNARPTSSEIAKTFMLERSTDENSVVPAEKLTTIDGYLWTTSYGAYDPEAQASLSEINNGQETLLLTGFRFYPRQGQVYFDTRQPLDKEFRLTIINKNVLRVGLRLRNRLHSDSIAITGAGFIYSTNDDKPTDLVQLAPVAQNLFISPSFPTAGDTLFGSYNFIDPNNDQESGSKLQWFKNSIELLEIAGQSSFINSDLRSGNKLQPGDIITFGVSPSDGTEFGVTVFSEAVTILARPPSVSNLTIEPRKIVEGSDPQTFQNTGRFDSSSVLFLSYDFNSEDIGASAKEANTTIEWFVDGANVKSGTFSETDSSDADILRLIPGESDPPLSSHPIGSTINVEVTPQNITGVQGEKVTSGTLSIVNTIPEISSDGITIEPEFPRANGQDTLRLLDFSVVDVDVDISVQTDQSTIQWKRSRDGVNFEIVTSLNDERVVPASMLEINNHWFAEVQPSDGLDEGTLIESNRVVISNP